MSNVVVVAKIGKNTGSTNPNDFIFHSSYNTFKIVAEATVVVSLTNNTNQTFTFAHHQSFIPLVNAFAIETGYSQVFVPNENNIALYSAKGGCSSTGVKFNYVQADVSNIYFNFDSDADKTVTIRYFVLEGV